MIVFYTLSWENKPFDIWTPLKQEMKLEAERKSNYKHEIKSSVQQKFVLILLHFWLISWRQKTKQSAAAGQSSAAHWLSTFIYIHVFTGLTLLWLLSKSLSFLSFCRTLSLSCAFLNKGGDVWWPRQAPSVRLLHLSSTDVDSCVSASLLWTQPPAPWFSWCWTADCFLCISLQDCWFLLVWTLIIVCVIIQTVFVTLNTTVIYIIEVYTSWYEAKKLVLKCEWY